MKKRKTRIVIYSFLLIFSFSLSLISVEKPGKTFTSSAESYKDSWGKIDSLMKKGLTQTAIDSVDKIYARAKKAGNADQTIKALIFGFRLMDYKEENSAQKVISRLNAEIEESKFPVTPVLHSMLAECYWNYYQNNRWQIYDRTQTENTDLQDINTWDLRTIMEKIISEYDLSLMEKGKLKQSRLSIYDEIIENRSPDDNLRPTLYDFLAHRAVDFFSTDDHSLTKPAFEFTLNSPDFFLPFDRFARLDIRTQDTSSLKFHAIRILQDPEAPKRNFLRYGGLTAAVGGVAQGGFFAYKLKNSQREMKTLSGKDLENLTSHVSDDWEDARSRRNRNLALTITGFFVAALGAAGFTWSFNF